MSLVKPYINRISAFDANFGSKDNIVVSVLGGDRIKSITYTIYNNSTNIKVLSETVEVEDTQETDVRSFIIPNVVRLSNNFSYYITAYTSNDTETSPSSTNTIFQCYMQPTFSVTYKNTNLEVNEQNFASNVTLKSENCFLKLKFDARDMRSSAQLNYAKVIVYGVLNNKKEKVYESSNVYVEPYEFTVNRLFPTSSTNKRYDSYTFEFYGVTTEYMEFKKVIENVYCNYSVTSENAFFTLFNNSKKGYIEINVDISDLANETDISRIDIKRRLVTNEEYLYEEQYDWITLLSIYRDSDTNTENKFIVFDTFNANNVMYEYKISLYDTSGNENNPTVQKVLSYFNGNFICDYNEIFNITVEFEMNTVERIQKTAIYEPYGSKYPFVAYNADTDYHKAQVSTILLASNSQYIDRMAQVKLSRKFNDFLTNKKAKILKLYNGDIYVISVYDNIPNSYFKQLGNGICSTTFNFVEVGELTQNSMQKLGLLGNFELHIQE